MTFRTGTKRPLPMAVPNPKPAKSKPNSTKKVEKGGLPWPLMVGISLSVVVFGGMFLRVALVGVP